MRMPTDPSTSRLTTGPSLTENAGQMGWRPSSASRGLTLPSRFSVVAATKTGRFDELVRTRGLEVYPDVIGYLEYLREAGIHRAVVSASEHCEALVAAAGVPATSNRVLMASVPPPTGSLGNLPPTPTWRRQVTSATWRNCAVFEDAISGYR